LQPNAKSLRADDYIWCLSWGIKMVKYIRLSSIPGWKQNRRPINHGNADAGPRTKTAGSGDENRSSVATVPRTAKSTDRLQQVYHTEATHHKAEISVKITTRSFLIKHEQL